MAQTIATEGVWEIRKTSMYYWLVDTELDNEVAIEEGEIDQLESLVKSLKEDAEVEA